ncbi:MAG: MMPL family transporter [Deltaproteobacteria bacterium]|nr:MMPL family transporter [Deltaproteobacteria bacterium]
MFKTYTHFIYRAKWSLALLFIALFVFSLLQASQLKLKSDFKELLPSNFQSIKDLDKIIERVGGEGSLIIAIESDNPPNSIRFANDLVAKLKQYPPEYVYQIDYNVSEAKKFFEENKFLYLNLEDLQEIHDRLDKRIQREKLKTSGLYLDFTDSEEQNSLFSTKDIEDKYKGKTSQYDEYIDGYFFGEKGKLMAVVLKPPGAASGVEFAKKLLDKVQSTVQELNPGSYDPSIKVDYTGKFRRTLFEYQTLIDDIVETALLCIFLVALAVFVYFRRLRMVVLMAWAIANGVAWTFAITQGEIGYLTTQTAFLGSIIVGNGINYSLIFMARYLEERKGKKSSLQALEISLRSTFSGTLASSLNTAVAFEALLMTQVRGFSHFGFIGGLGMFACWVATYTVLPVFLSITEQILPVVKEDHVPRFNLSLMTPLVKLFQKHARPAVYAGLVFSILCVPLLIYFIPHSLEYNFNNLKVKTKGQAIAEQDKLGDRVRAIFGSSVSPAVLLLDRADQALPLCKEIMRRSEMDPPEQRMVQNCKSLYSYVPEDQEQKIELLKSTRKLLEDSSMNFLNEEQKQEVERFKKEFVGKTIALKDIPENIVKIFREKNGEVGRLALVYPSDHASIWEGKNLMRFADLIRRNVLPGGEVITGSGDAVIFSDLLRAVIHDGPRSTALAFIAVCLVVSLIFRERRGIFFIIGTLLVGALWMGGVIALFDIKINFFNFIAIPTTFGIGVDYGVNIYQRYKLEGRGSLTKVIKTTGGAVALCSLTTIIGYFTLIIAKNQALVSFGWIGIIGELTCLIAALVFIPCCVILREQRKA